jgi:hypothetical protein
MMALAINTEGRIREARSMGVESGHPSLINWRKSAFSADSGNCVEICALVPSVLVRDSQDLDGPILTVKSRQWADFVQRMRRDELAGGR